MRFTQCPLSGAYVVELEPNYDERGFFARTWCREEFQVLGLKTDIAQCSISSNLRKGTLRGMHYQMAPFEEAKLVRCTRGAIYDVIIDLRSRSSTFGNWFGLELSGDNGKMLFVPEGFAHGYQTLADLSEVFYQISEAHHPSLSGGVRWNDPAFQIKWPLADPILSNRDLSFPDFTKAAGDPRPAHNFQ